MEDISIKTIGKNGEEKEWTLMEWIKSDKIRIHRTINLYLTFLGVGALGTLPGVTVSDLQRNVNATSTEMGFFLTCRFIGFCIGSLSVGFLFRRFHRLTVFTTMVFIICAINVAIPFISNYYFLIAVILTISIVMGAQNSSTNVLCLDLWMEKPGPFFQGLHLSYGLGAILGPLIAEPFLSPDDKGSNNSTIANSTEFPTTTLNPEPVKDIGNVKASFCIISAFLFAVIISSVISILIDRTEIKSNTEKKRVTNQIPGKLLPRCLIGLGMLFLGGYLALENVFTQFLVTFVTKSSLKLSKQTGSFITSTFWGTYCFARAINVVLATKIKPLHLLFVHLTIATSAGIILSIFGESHVAVMWAGTALLGYGCASLWPSSYSFMENYVGISEVVSGLFTVAGSVSGFLFSLGVTELIDDYPAVLLYNVCICCGICITALVGQLRVVWHITGKSGRTTSIDSSLDYLTNDKFVN